MLLQRPAPYPHCTQHLAAESIIITLFQLCSNLCKSSLFVSCRVKVVCGLVLCSAQSVPEPVFTITEKAHTRLKAPTSAFTFKTLLRHYAKQA